LTRRGVWALAKILLAVGLIAWLVSQHLLGQNEIPFAKLGRLASTWPWFLAAQVPYGIVLVLGAQRWRILLRRQGIEYGLRDTHSLTLIGMFFNQVMLGSTGGDVVKAYYVASESPGRRTAAVFTVFIDRALGLVVLVVLVCVAIFLNFDLVRSNEHLFTLAIGLWVALGAMVLGGILFFTGVFERPAMRALSARLPLRALREKIADIFLVYRTCRGDMLQIFALSAGVHLLVIATNLCLLRCLEPVLPDVVPFILLVPVAQIVMAVPITPAGLGTGEMAYDYLFKLVGLNCGLLVSLLQRGTYYVWAVLGCIAYVRRKGRVRRALAESENAEETTALLAE